MRDGGPHSAEVAQKPLRYASSPLPEQCLNSAAFPQGQRCEVVDHTALAPSLVISHEITETSPLHGLSIDDIREANGAIFVSVAATDDNHLQASPAHGSSSSPCT